MSLMQQAIRTYDNAASSYAGVYIEGMKEPLAPIGHLITKAVIEITIDKDGKFINAKKVLDDDAKTIFPVTEESSGRTSAPSPHPLCEQIGYLSPDNEVKYCLYVEQLEKWCDSEYSHPVIRSVLNYVKSRTIIQDLSSLDLLKVGDKGESKNDKDFIRWIVLGIGEESGPCWTNRSLQERYSLFYLNEIEDRKKGICMINGDSVPLTTQHAKGIFTLNGNAKLISSNDSTNYTYRGRFIDDSEALSVGYMSSQKGHNALRWIIQNQGVIFSGRAFICWNPEGKTVPKPTAVLRKRGSSSQTSIYNPSDYKQNLMDTLNSWKSDFPQDEKIVTAVFDAATTGRLAVAYYSELQAADFINRLGYWDETCCWPNGQFGIQSPTLKDIINCAYGTLRGDKVEADEAIARQMMLKLAACRIEKKMMPKDTMTALVKKAGNLSLYPDKAANKYLRRNLLFVTCAVIRKYHMDHDKEEWEMALDPEKRDRSYQYGRLLAVLEKEERDTYKADEEREPNALRMQTVFTQRPLYASRKLSEQIRRAYFKRLSPAQQRYYEKIIGQIMEQLGQFEDEANKPLEDTYLLGYYLQKNSMYTKNTENHQPENKEEEV